MTTESHNGKYGVYIDQPDEQGYKLYTGIGSINRPPSFYNDYSMRLKNDDNKSSLFRIRTYVKGKGRADLYIRWYFENGKASKLLHIGRYYLPVNYRLLKRKFVLPKNAIELRVVFIVRKIDGQLSTLYLDDFVLDRKCKESTEDMAKINPILERP